ncbi:acyl-CoA dehydrogenase/oxidase [Cladochytrium replicatum]|nr:acyl-CoA dehydrogenase/oxidase [Cladochytrium replicatum]
MSTVDLFALSPRVQKLKETLSAFVENECIPAEKIFHDQLGKGLDRWSIVPPIIEDLKKKARALGLWNLWIPKGYNESPGLTNLEYATLCEIMGRSAFAPEATNCAAPDTGNMEVLIKYGNDAQKRKWLVPLMEGQIRSAFAMTEPRVASSDATNIETLITPVKNAAGVTTHYVINGRKWWISGAGDPRCKVYILMGKSDPGNSSVHKQQSVIIVPADTPGITTLRALNVYGYDDAPHGHCEMIFENVLVGAENMVLGEGRGFEIVQGRLGPGRIHHCMRGIGAAERALDHHIARVTDPSRRTFGKVLFQHGKVLHDIAESRIEIDAGRLLVLRAADAIDKVGAKGALNQIAIAKVMVPAMVNRVVDRAIQAHGGGGVSDDFPMAYLWATNRTLRIADGPDEVHNQTIAKTELRRAQKVQQVLESQKERTAAMRKELGLNEPTVVPIRTTGRAKL